MEDVFWKTTSTPATHNVFNLFTSIQTCTSTDLFCKSQANCVV